MSKKTIITASTILIAGIVVITILYFKVENTNISNISVSDEIDTAITLAKNSEAIIDGIHVEDYLRNILRERMGNLKIKGWRAKKVGDSIFLVRYVIDQDGMERGYYFEVNIRERKVKNLAKNPDLMKRYNITREDLFRR